MRRGGSRRGPALLLAILLAASSVALKAGFAVRAPEAQLGAGAMVAPGLAMERVRAVLRDEGWRELGVDRFGYGDLTDLKLVSFQATDCDGPVAIAALPSNGEAAHLLDPVIGPGRRLSYVYRGRVVDGAPAWAYVFDKIAFAAEAFGVPGLHYQPLVAIVEPDPCHADATLASYSLAKP